MTKLQLPRSVFLDLQDMADVLMNITHTKGHCMVCSSLSLEHNPYCPVVRWYKRDDCPGDCDFVSPYGYVISDDCEVHGE